MMVEKASGRVSPLRQGAGKSPGSSRSRFDDDGGGLQYVSGKSDPSLRFFPLRGLYRPRGVVGRWARRPHHGWARTGAGPRPPVVWLAYGPLRLIFGLHEASVKIGGSAFVSSNSDNISYVTFLKYKNSRNRKLALWHLVSRLVLENA
jgi:hypothetical protein